MDAFEKKTPYAAEALIAGANRCLIDGRASLAKPVFKAVYADGQSPAVRAAALNGLAKADPAGAQKLILEALSSPEPKIQFAAIQSAPDAFGKELTGTLVPLLPKLTPTIKARGLGLMDASAEKVVIESVKDEQENVRIAAIESLGRIGGASAIPALLNAYASDTRPAKQAAEFALAAIPGKDVNPALEGFAAVGEAKNRAAAIAALAMRNAATVAPALLKYVAESDTTVVKAAAAALRVLGGESEVAPLAQLYAAQPSTDVLNALQAVSGRVNNKATASQQLLALAEKAQPKTVAGLLTVVSILGQTAAIDALVQYAGNTNEEIANAAIRALGNWPDFSASQQLLKIASSADFKAAQQSMALQGLARLIESSDTEAPQSRLDAALSALKVSVKPDDKKQLLMALGSVPLPKAADPILEALNDAGLKNEAGVAGAALAEALVSVDKTAAQQLARKVKEANISREINRKADGVLRR
jgi:HEAT repeat protein